MLFQQSGLLVRQLLQQRDEFSIALEQTSCFTIRSLALPEREVRLEWSCWLSGFLCQFAMERFDLSPQVVVFGGEDLDALRHRMELGERGIHIGLQSGNGFALGSPGEQPAMLFLVLLRIPILKLRTFGIRQGLAASRSVVQLPKIVVRTHCPTLAE